VFYIAIIDDIFVPAGAAGCSYNNYDSVSLKYPLEPEAAPIAPDLLMSAGEMGK